LFYVTGLRLSELINLTDANTDTINLTLKVLGKRNKERIIPISSDIANEIEKYRALKIAETIKKNNLLFVKNDGEVLYPKLVYRVVNSYLLLASSTNKKSPHVLRHTFATHLLNNGADLNAIKELLGHASLAATQVYTHNSFEKINRIYKQAHPRA
jgi:integrase/recombinase XerC